MRECYTRSECGNKENLPVNDLIPLALWLFSVLWSLAVCGICVHRGRFLSSERHPKVSPVSWNVVVAQVVSVLFAGFPFIVYIMVEHDISDTMHDFYERHMVVAVAVVIVLVFAELAVMYAQARRAMFTQRDEVLEKAGRRAAERR